MNDPHEGRTVDGMIVTGASADAIPSRFGPVLADAVRAVSKAAPDASTYVFGSVATGQAVAGRSDVDLLAIRLDAELAASIAADLSAVHIDVCREVAVGAATSGAFVGAHDEAYGNRVFLRHYCVLLAGSARDRPAKDFPADARAARGFNGDIARHRDRWRAEVADASEPAELARRIARKTLLAVAGLASVHDGTWTTDRETAAARWSEIEPARAAGLETLLGWTTGAPNADRAEVERVLEAVVDPLVARFAADIGLWP